MMVDPTIAAVGALRAELWAAGFRPIPVYNYDAPGDSPGKRPLSNSWPEHARQNPPFCAAAPAVRHAMNTGILCDGLQAIDLDIDDPELAQRIRDLATSMLGEAPTRTRQGSPRVLMLYAAAEGEPPKRTITGSSHTKTQSCKIEILGHGQQFVARGRHYTGAALEWYPAAPGQVLHASLPAVTEDQVQAFLAACALIIGAPPPVKPNGHDQHHVSARLRAKSSLSVAAALNSIPNNGPAEWERWNNIGMAVWTATGGSSAGWEIFNAWSEGNASYDAAATRERWDHYPNSPPTKIGAGTIFYLAREALQGNTGPLRNGRNHDNEDASKAKTDNDFVITALPHLGRTRIPPRQWAYGNYLLFGTAAVLGAVDGGGKGAKAVVMALAMITGRPLLDEKVWRPGSVAIVSYEDNDEEWHRRIAAACNYYGIDYDLALDNIHFIHKKTGRVCFVRMDEKATICPDGDVIIDALGAIGVVLLIIDPFNHAHSLDDGNNNVMMARVAAEVNRVAEESGAAVLVLHHLRKGSSGQVDDLMGATSLRATFRSTRILAGMTQEEAKNLNIKDHWRYSRIAGSKENYAPPPDKATWFKLESVDLGNGDERYPDGDNIQVTVAWKPPALFEGIDDAALSDIFNEIRRGTGRADGTPDYSPHRQAEKFWVGQVIVDCADRSITQANKLIKQWIDNDVLRVEKYNHPVQRKQADHIVLNEQKVTEILSTLRPEASSAAI
jgi:hypothetical protein